MPRSREAVAAGRASVRVDVHGSGTAQVFTGLPVFDHLLGLLAEYASFDLSLEVEPGAAGEEVAAAGTALGVALREALNAAESRRHGAATVPADEALAHVSLEASGRPLVVSNVDLSEARVAGLGTDIAARFLHELTQGAGLTLHLRLIEGEDTQHVLETIFKSLGVALAESCRPRAQKE